MGKYLYICRKSFINVKTNKHGKHKLCFKRVSIPFGCYWRTFLYDWLRLGINGLIIPFLRTALDLTTAESYLVLAATFSTFVIFGYPCGLIIKAIGYKKTMILSFLFFAVGLYLFIPSAENKSFSMFLLASFISGIGNTMLQAAVNPYITILGPLEGAATRMSMMGIANKAAWAIAPIFLGVFLNLSDVKLEDIKIAVSISFSGIFVRFGNSSCICPAAGSKSGRRG